MSIAKLVQWAAKRGLFAGVVLGLSVSAYAVDIQKLSVRGNTFIPEQTILSGLSSKVGLPFNPEIISQDIQKIYDIGFFSNITVDVDTVDDGVHVTFNIIERPMISEIRFTGNNKLKKEKLEEVLTLSSTSLTDAVNLKVYPVKIQEDIGRLTDLYHKEGYSDAKITAELIPDPAAPTEKVILEYQIEERKRLIVREINFEGNPAFPDEELRKVMTTKVKGFFSFITGSGKYQQAALNADLEQVQFFYADHGYLDAKVADYTLDIPEGTNDLHLTIMVNEGDVYTMSAVEMSGNTIYTTEELKKKLKTTVQRPFSRSEIRSDLLAIIDQYGQKGYIRAMSDKTAGKLDVAPDIRVNRQEKTAQVTYVITEGVPHTINRISFKGNRVTRDKVMRREMKLQEGDLYNSTALRQSQQNVFNLGLFDELNIEMTDGAAPHTVDLTFEVKERSQIGSFNIGGGWDTVDKWALTGGFTSANVWGLAHTLDFSATIGTLSSVYNLDYYIPRVYDSRYSLGVNVYRLSKDYAAYDSQSVGGGLRFGRKITDTISASLKYRYEQVEISHVEDDASVRIRESEGLSTTSAVSLTLKRTTINNVLLPTKGMLTEVKGEVAGGILGAKNDFYRMTVSNNIYFPLYKEIALRLKGEYAMVEAYGASEKVPILERLYAGGANTIRGYKERSVGPKDENNEAIGGNRRVLLTGEIVFPVQKNVRLLTFLDAGDVYGADEQLDVATFRTGAGVGVRFSTPLGLLRFDWGYKLNREEGESRDEFHFGIGNIF